MAAKSPKTVNNVLTVLGVMLRTAVEWNVIEQLPCAIKLLTVPKGTAGFYDFAEYERLVSAAQSDRLACLVELLGGEAGLRGGESLGLEWANVDLQTRQLCVAQSEWRGHVTMPKGGRLRYVPLTRRLAETRQRARDLRSARVLCGRNGEPITLKVLQVGEPAGRSRWADAGVDTGPNEVRDGGGAGSRPTRRARRAEPMG